MAAGSYATGFTPGGFGGTYSSTITNWIGPVSGGPKAVAAPVTYIYNTYNTTPVTPTVEPKLELNVLYGKPMSLAALGFARIGASPAPIVGPYMDKTAKTVSFMVSFGVPANPAGNRKIYAIYLDNELCWSSVAGGTTPGEGTFSGDSFDFLFHQGRLDQPVDLLETQKFPGDECAYRPQMLVSIRNIKYERFVKNTGKPVPYVAIDVGDVTDGVDPHDGINLGAALEMVAWSPWAGYSVSGFEATGITDVVDAILIKDNFDIIDLCKTVTREYRNIDLTVSDKIRINDRGSMVSPNYVFNRNSVIAGEDAIVVTRSGATEQRREFELVAIDPDQDYTAVSSLAKIPRDPMIISAAVGKESVTIPLVIDASTRQALATFAQNYEENARRKIAIKVPVSGYRIEPGDLFALTSIADGMDNEVFKCTETTHGANWMVDIQGEAILRCSIYQEPVPGTAVFASGDFSNGLRYCYVHGSEPQEWHGLSWVTNPDDWVFWAYGAILASSYAKVAGRPTFLMGGNDFFWLNFGSAGMMISHDGINWATVYNVGAPGHRVIYNIVWDAAEQAFYADLVGPPHYVDVGIARPPTTMCLRSTDGYTWEEVAADFWAHTPDRFTPDGCVGYDPETDLEIRPEDLEIAGAGRIVCTAYANGIWMAGGRDAASNSVTYYSLDGGVNWSVATTGGTGDPGVGNEPIITMVAAPLSDIEG